MEKDCKNCSEKFIPNSGKQKFCSNRCKMAYSRKDSDALREAINSVTKKTETIELSKYNELLDKYNALYKEKIEGQWIKEGESLGKMAKDGQSDKLTTLKGIVDQVKNPPKEKETSLTAFEIYQRKKLGLK